jgi:hypothetical protein
MSINLMTWLHSFRRPISLRGSARELTPLIGFCAQSP